MLCLVATVALTRPYLPLAPRARPAVGLLAATVAVDVAAAAVDGWNWSLLRAIDRGDTVSQGTADLSDALVSVLGIVQFLLLFATAIYFIQWFKRAYDNVEALGADRRFSGGWAIWSWVVPVLNLWRPRRIAHEIWHGGGPDSEPVPAVVNWWWGAWLFSTWADNLVFRISFSDPTTSRLAAVVSDAIDLGAAVLAIVVVRTLTRRLDGAAPEPAPLPFLPEA